MSVPRCCIFPTVGSKRRPSFLHETSGIPGNFALDFMAPGGTVVLSPLDVVVERWSGHSPKAGEVEPGIFGWSMYLRELGGARRVLFLTHLGSRRFKVGARVCRGETLGRVGAWPDDPGRSHLHLGVTSPIGEDDAKAEVRAIAAGVRLRPMG